MKNSIIILILIITFNTSRAQQDSTDIKKSYFTVHAGFNYILDKERYYPLREEDSVSPNNGYKENIDNSFNVGAEYIKRIKGNLFFNLGLQLYSRTTFLKAYCSKDDILKYNSFFYVSDFDVPYIKKYYVLIFEQPLLLRYDVKSFFIELGIKTSLVYMGKYKITNFYSQTKTGTYISLNFTDYSYISNVGYKLHLFKIPILLYTGIEFRHHYGTSLNNLKLGIKIELK